MAKIQSKYCRVCWNTNGWRKPSGSAVEQNGFYKEHGFGHEEWLFNYEWCIEGFKYGFLQPFNHAVYRHTGKTIDVAVYTKFEQVTLLVGTIKNVSFPTVEQTIAAFERMQKNGWTEQMKQDVQPFVKSVQPEFIDPDLAINIRFRPEDVRLFDPMPVLPTNHLASKTRRYLARDWKDPLPNLGEPTSIDPRRNEDVRIRAAQQAAIVEPQHVRMQNRLFETLKQRFGSSVVKYEEGFVDLRIEKPGGDTFYEIKTDSTAKKCIRNAIGQLLEYSSYPAESRAKMLIVVGDAFPTSDDKKYLEHIRQLYSLPLYYARFNWETDDTDPPV